MSLSLKMKYTQTDFQWIMKANLEISDNNYLKRKLRNKS